MRAICAAACLILLCGVAATSAGALGKKRTAACKAITVDEALEAMEYAGSSLSVGFGDDTPIHQLPGVRRFKGREVTCSWAAPNAFGDIELLITVLPTPAEAKRYFKARGMCFREARISLGAEACGGPGGLLARWGRFAIWLQGAASPDGSGMSLSHLVTLARAVFSRAPRIFPGS
jgi:hypothetical protein